MKERVCVFVCGGEGERVGGGREEETDRQTDRRMDRRTDQQAETDRETERG